MAVAKSILSEVADEFQAALRLILKPLGFRVRGRNFNRQTPDGLTQVIGVGLHRGDYGVPFNPSMCSAILRIEFGAFVPEVLLLQEDRILNWVQAANCDLRWGLDTAMNKPGSQWWLADRKTKFLEQVIEQMEHIALPMLERFDSRSKILSDWPELSAYSSICTPVHVVRSLILLNGGDVVAARDVMSAAIVTARVEHPGHAQYLAKLSAKLGIIHGAQ
jgi:Domain of unknown function (DUF4304)